MLVGGCAAERVVSWGYGTDDGPEHWALLDPTFALAASGRAQSPIDLPALDVVERPGTPLPIRFDYGGTTTLSLTHDGRLLRAELAAPRNLWIGMVPYRLQQIVCHAPAEHTINGQQAPAELQFVHRNDEGGYAVVAVLVETGDDHHELGKLWHVLPAAPDANVAGAGDHVTASGIELADLLPADHRCYRYQGSMTTPPCHEQVSWLVLAQPLKASAAQLGRLQRLFSGHAFPQGNRRPIQPRHGRSVLFG
jgi:carbonic anhydrase